MTKPRHEGSPGGPELAARLLALGNTARFRDRGPEAMADALGVSISTLYRWRAGEAKRISRSVARGLATLEGEAKGK